MTKTKTQKLRAALVQRPTRQRNMPIGRAQGQGFYSLKAAYKMLQKLVPKGTGRAIGEKVGSLVPIPGGKELGGYMGEVGSKITGVGDYTIRKNSIINPDGEDVSSNISFSDFGAARVRIKKREFLGLVIAPAVNPQNFSQLQYRIQATDNVTFPWCSGVSKHFAEWKLMGCVFGFETTSSNYSATVGLGTVAMATQYNSNALPFASMSSILQSAYHTRGNPSETLLHGVECDESLQASDRLYTRRPGCAGPPNLYDHGVLTVATEGLPVGSAGVTLGRLYATYDIEMSLPELPIVPPFANFMGWGHDTAVLAGQPPLGNTLGITADAASEMTISGTLGANILLTAATSGPLPRPAMNPEDENNLCCWLNDNTAAATQQFMSFARAGDYQLTINYSSAGATAPADGAFTCTPFTSAQVTVLAPITLVSATDYAKTWSVRITTTQANGAVVLTNADAAAHVSNWKLVPDICG